MDAVKDVEYPRRGGAVLARYDGRCEYCGGRIIRNVSHIKKLHSDWMHQRCAAQLRRECCATVAS
jgi:hypothetical protein